MSSGPPRALSWSALLLVLIAAAWWFGSGNGPAAELPEVEAAARVRDGDAAERSAPGVAIPTPARPAPDPAPDRRPQPVPDTEVRVLCAATCAPLAGAEVFVLDGRGRVLGSRITGPRGIVRDLPARDRAHGVVAWHPDFQLRGQLLDARRVELSLPAVRYVEVRVEPGPVAREWLDTCKVSVRFQFIPDGNPVRRGPDYLEERLFAHLGLDGQDWPVGEPGCRIPCFLDADAWAVLRTMQTLPNRLLQHQGSRDERPRLVPHGHGSRVRPQPPRTRVDRTASEVRIAPAPKSEHAVVLRHLRRPGEQGEAWLCLYDIAARRTFSTEYGTFEDLGGDLRFAVFDLGPGEFRPWLVFRDGDEVKRIVACEEFTVRGRSEYRLVPVPSSRLELSVTGAAVGEPIEVELRHEDRLPVASADGGAGGALSWSCLRPGRYTIRASSGSRRVFDRQIELRPGATGSVELELRATCKVALVAAGRPGALKIRDLVTGSVRRWTWADWEPIREASAGGTDADRGRELSIRVELPYGSYEFSTTIGRRNLRRVAELDRPAQTVRLD